MYVVYRIVVYCVHNNIMWLPMCTCWYSICTCRCASGADVMHQLLSHVPNAGPFPSLQCCMFLLTFQEATTLECMTLLFTLSASPLQ